MDKLKPAIRLYRQVLPKPKQSLNSVTLRKLQVWLQDDVGSVVDELVRRPAFREYASWAVQTLGSGSNSPERKAIDDVETALFEVGKAYGKLLSNERILAQVQKSFPPCDHVIREKIEIGGGDAPRVLERQLGAIDETAVEISQLRQLCDEDDDAYSLINLEDYFEPRQEFRVGPDGRRVQSATHIVSLTPELHPVGNFILQSANRRLEQLSQLLTTIRRKVTAAIRKLERTYKEQDRAEAAWDRLQGRVKLYRQTFQSGPKNDLRNACMILMQIYAAFHPAPDLDWLGLPEQLSQEARGTLQLRIRGFRGGELFERVHGALIAVQHLYEDQDPKLSAREEAIARGDLVLVAHNRELYWDEKLISFASSAREASWELLVPLIKRARNRGNVTEKDVFGDKVIARGGMAMRVKRLKPLLPGSLRKLIVPGSERRTYRLEVEPQRIYIF